MVLTVMYGRNSSPLFYIEKTGTIPSNSRTQKLLFILLVCPATYAPPYSLANWLYWTVTLSSLPAK